MEASWAGRPSTASQADTQSLACSPCLFSLPDTQSLAWHPSCWTMAGWTGRDVRLSGQNQDTGLAQHIQMLSLIQGSLYKRKRKPRGGELPSTVCV